MVRDRARARRELREKQCDRERERLRERAPEAQKGVEKAACFSCEASVERRETDSQAPAGQ